MEVLPYHRVNGILINSRTPFIEYRLGFVMTFENYVLSQIHFPLVIDLFDRPIKDYKDIYLSMTEGKEFDRETLDRVLRYFYHDVYKSLRNKKPNVYLPPDVINDFKVDLSSLKDYYPVKELPAVLSLQEKIEELEKAYNSKELYLLDMR